MEVHFTEGQQAQIDRLARQSGKAPEQVVQDAVELLLDDARFTAAVEDGIASLDRGEFLTHEEVGTRIEQLLTR